MRIFLPIILLAALAGAAVAVPVDANAPDGVAARYFSTAFMFVLGTDGVTYRINTCIDCTDTNWHPYNDSSPLPVSLSEIADWTPFYVTSISGEVYGYVSADGIWRLIPSPPCATPVSTSSSSMGDVKSLFR